MRDSIDTMLTVARAHAGGGDRATVGELMATLDLPPTTYDEVVLSAPLSPLVAAVRPLLDNAERHGVGPPRVEVSRDGRTVVITVLDDGARRGGGRRRAGSSSPATPRTATAPASASPWPARMARTVGGDLVARPGPGGRFEVRVPAR